MIAMSTMMPKIPRPMSASRWRLEPAPRELPLAERLERDLVVGDSSSPRPLRLPYRVGALLDRPWSSRPSYRMRGSATA